MTLHIAVDIEKALWTSGMIVLTAIAGTHLVQDTLGLFFLHLSREDGRDEDIIWYSWMHCVNSKCVIMIRSACCRPNHKMQPKSLALLIIEVFISNLGLKGSARLYSLSSKKLGL